MESKKFIRDNPKLVDEWHPTKNGDVSVDSTPLNSHSKFWWLGKCSHEWPSTPSDRNSKSAGCPFCAPNPRTLFGFNDLQTKNPELAKEWHPTLNGSLTSKMVTINSGRKVWWKCKICDHVWKTAASSRTSGKNCPECKRGKIGSAQRLRSLSAGNTLEEKFPVVSEEWHPTKNGKLTARDVSKCSQQKVWWLGKCGHEWYANIGNRTNNNAGCPECIRNTVKQTCLKRYGVENPQQNQQIALRTARTNEKIIDVPYWKTSELLACQGGWEPKVVSQWNQEKEEFVWQIVFKIPKEEPLIGGRTYRVDAYLPNKDLYVEIKGWFRTEDSRLKWEWFHRTYPNSELWNKKKLISLGIIK